MSDKQTNNHVTNPDDQSSDTSPQLRTPFSSGQNGDPLNGNPEKLSSRDGRYGGDDEDNEADDDDFPNSDDFADKVRQILTADGDFDLDPEYLLNRHVIFTQMDILCHFPNASGRGGQCYGWKELSRWLKYEEKVDAGGRWSKPHVSTVSLRALHQLKFLLDNERMLLMLDFLAEPMDWDNVRGQIVDRVSEYFSLTPRSKSKLSEIMRAPHKHKDRKADKKNQEFLQSKLNERSNSLRRKSFFKKEGKDLWNTYTAYPKHVTPDNLEKYEPNKKLKQKLPSDAETANVLVGVADLSLKPITFLFRFAEPILLDDATEVDLPTRFLFVALGVTNQSTLWQMSELGRATALLLNDKVFCEIAYKAVGKEDLKIGLDEFLDDLTVLPPSVWDPTTRLEPPTVTMTLERIGQRLHDTGRTAAKVESLATDVTHGDDSLAKTNRLFGGLAKDVKRRYPHMLSDFTDGINMQSLASIIFLYFACITPIVTFGGLMTSKTDGYMGTIEMLISGAFCGVTYALFSGQPLTIVGATGPLLVFETIVFEICRNLSIPFMPFRFWIGAWIFFIMFLMVAFDLSYIIKYITRFTEESFAVLISVIFIYESISKLFDVWSHNRIRTSVISEPFDYMCQCRFNSTSSVMWSDQGGGFGGGGGAGGGFNGSAVAMAISGGGGGGYGDSYDDKILSDYSNNTPPTLREECYLNTGHLEVNRRCIPEKVCSALNGSLTGPGCVPSVTDSVPDVFLLSCVLMFGTFAVAIFFRNLRSTTYFPMFLRCTIADFAVFLSLVIWTTIDYFLGLNTSKLDVPTNFQTTREDRGWIINPLLCSPWWLGLVAIAPACLATILLFLDQQITAVIVNRKENKLEKGHGYHLDLLVISVQVLFCSIFGLPWFCAATVRSISHVKSLVRESEVNAPGESPKMLGIREQRMTGLFIHLLIGLSIFGAIFLKYIPMPVLYGIFLYMGITSLNGVQYIDRILILFMPMKYQPDYIYLRHVQTSHVHIFTLVQIVCSALMWTVKSFKVTSIAFPVMLVLLVIVRKLLDYFFTQRDLYWLDNLLPEANRRKKEDQLRALEFASQSSQRRRSTRIAENYFPSESRKSSEVP